MCACGEGFDGWLVCYDVEGGRGRGVWVARKSVHTRVFPLLISLLHTRVLGVWFFGGGAHDSQGKGRGGMGVSLTYYLHRCMHAREAKQR